MNTLTIKKKIIIKFDLNLELQYGMGESKGEEIHVNVVEFRTTYKDGT